MSTRTPTRRRAWSVRWPIARWPFVRSAILRCPIIQYVTCTAALLLLTSLSLSAQTATVAGTVLADFSERPLPLAEVSFPLLGRSTRTDSAGNCTLTDFKAGRQRFRSRLLGYAPFES